MGQKKKPGRREPNGRLSRRPEDTAARNIDALDREERETIGVGIEARIRIHGVAKAFSRDQMAGSFVGRLCLGGELSRDQYDAAMSYMEDWHNNLAAISAVTAPQPGAVDLNATRGAGVGRENVARTRLHVKRWKDAQAAVQERQNELRGTGNLFGALDHCLLRDQSFTHMVGSLREALNALARHYRLMAKVAA